MPLYEPGLSQWETGDSRRR